MKKHIIGIDPGTNGAISVTDSEGNVIKVDKMPDTPKDVLDILSPYKDDSICYIEKVGGMPGQGGSAMFNFGKNYGHLEMALYALEIPFVTVTPQKWQKEFQLSGKKSEMGYTKWKNVLKEKAQQVFPKIKMTLWKSDALLIGRYGYIKEFCKK